jgi:hypothetical protein
MKKFKIVKKHEKKPTARDKALAKISGAKYNLKAARATAVIVTRVASGKRKAAKEAFTEQERAEGLIIQRENQLARAQDALVRLDEKLEALKQAKLAKAAAKASKSVHAAPTEGAPEPEADEDEDEDEGEDEEQEKETGATADDDMGDDDVDETPTADDMGDDDEEVVSAE